MAEDLVRQSVVDRIIGADRMVTGGGGQARPPRTWEESVDLLERNVLRHLEQLLNTRQISEPAEPPYDQLERSLYNYGLMDFSSLSADAARTPEEVRQLIKECIELFEPRLTDVEVVDPSTEGPKGKDVKLRRTVRFRIEATLRTDPDPERVEFDTVLDIASKRFEVRSDSNA